MTHTTLLTELLFHILLLLPIESLVICKSVCKEWYSLISSDSFIKARLGLKKNKYLFFRNGEVLSTLYLNDLMYDRPMSQVSFRLPSIANRLNYVGLIGSTNGLICISLDACLCICNPATRIFNMVYGGFSRLHPNHVAYGFGYDMDNDDYKIVAITNFGKSIKVYSLKTGLWVKKNFVYPGERTPSKGIFLNGCLHWMDHVPDDLNIVSFGVHTETFGQLAAPVYNDGPKMLHLDVLGDRLSVLCNYTQSGVMDLWVMQDYGSSDSWTRLATIVYPENDGWMRFWQTLWMSEEGKILLRFGHGAYLYDSIHGLLTFVTDTGSSAGLCSFDESLISPIGPGIRYRLRDSKAKSRTGEASSV